MNYRTAIVLAVLAGTAICAPVLLNSRSNARLAERVVMIGIDGLTFDPVCLSPGTMPNVESLIASGSFTRFAKATTDAVSGAGWSSFLCGMPPLLTGIQGNFWTPPWLGGEPPITPITGNGPIPCSLDEAKRQAPELRVNAYFDWGFLEYLIDDAVVDKRFYCDGHENGYDPCDMLIADEVVGDLSSVSAMPDLTFVYFGSLDEMGGHRASWCSEEYISYAAKVDGYVGRIVATLEDTGVRNTTAIILSADHGGSFGTRHHGMARDDNINIPFVVSGPSIKVNHVISETPIEVTDVAATALAILGLESNKWWRGIFPEEILA